VRHTIQTTHIQRLISNALALAEAVDDQGASHEYTKDGRREVPRREAEVYLPIGPGRPHEHSRCLPEEALEKAIADLRHAADELDAERLSCLGWRQV
jgi:hypothetical protein